MAQKRMFNLKITDSDKFLDLPLSSQALYFHLNMHADDDGFVDSTKKIKRMIGASDGDLRMLMEQSFILPFETGVIVIKDWKIHNYIPKDRYQKTIYTTEFSRLGLAENNSYTDCIQNVSKLDTQNRLDKVSKDKVSKDNKKTVPEIGNVADEESKEKIPYKEIIDYLNEKTDKAYRSTSSQNKKLIKARWNEGYQLDDFKTVIDNKLADWTGTEWERFLQPSTLFGPKFDKYLNEIPQRSMELSTEEILRARYADDPDYQPF